MDILSDTDEHTMFDSSNTPEAEETGLVLAVPAVILETSSVKPEVQPAGTVVEGQEYENLVATSQYYEQVQFMGREQQALGRMRSRQEEEEEEGLYSIPQVMSLNKSTTELTADQEKVATFDLFGMGRRFPSMRNTLKKEKKKKGIGRKEKASSHSWRFR